MVKTKGPSDYKKRKQRAQEARDENEQILKDREKYERLINEFNKQILEQIEKDQKIWEEVEQELQKERRGFTNKFKKYSEFADVIQSDLNNLKKTASSASSFKEFKSLIKQVETYENLLLEQFEDTAERTSILKQAAVTKEAFTKEYKKRSGFLRRAGKAIKGSKGTVSSLVAGATTGSPLAMWMVDAMFSMGERKKEKEQQQKRAGLDKIFNLRDFFNSKLMGASAAKEEPEKRTKAGRGSGGRGDGGFYLDISPIVNELTAIKTILSTMRQTDFKTEQNTREAWEELLNIKQEEKAQASAQKERDDRQRAATEKQTRMQESAAADQEERDLENARLRLKEGFGAGAGASIIGAGREGGGLFDTLAKMYLGKKMLDLVPKKLGFFGRVGTWITAAATAATAYLTVKNMEENVDFSKNEDKTGVSRAGAVLAATEEPGIVGAAAGAIGAPVGLGPQAATAGAGLTAGLQSLQSDKEKLARAQNATLQIDRTKQAGSIFSIMKEYANGTTRGIFDALGMSPLGQEEHELEKLKLKRSQKEMFLASTEELKAIDEDIKVRKQKIKEMKEALENDPNAPFNKTLQLYKNLRDEEYQTYRHNAAQIGSKIMSRAEWEKASGKGPMRAEYTPVPRATANENRTQAQADLGNARVDFTRITDPAQQELKKREIEILTNRVKQEKSLSKEELREQGAHWTTNKDQLKQVVDELEKTRKWFEKEFGKKWSQKQTDLYLRNANDRIKKEAAEKEKQAQKEDRNNRRSGKLRERRKRIADKYRKPYVSYQPSVGKFGENDIGPMPTGKANAPGNYDYSRPATDEYFPVGNTGAYINQVAQGGYGAPSAYGVGGQAGPSGGYTGTGGGAPGAVDLPSNLSVQQSTVDFIKKNESFRATPYWDVNGWAIGYGSHTINGRPVQQGDTITQKDAEQQIVDRLNNEFLPGMRNYVKRPISQSQFDSLASLTWNTGPGIWSDNGDVARAVNEGNDQKVSDIMRTYYMKGHPELAGRRAAEADMYASGAGSGIVGPGAATGGTSQKDFGQWSNFKQTSHSFEEGFGNLPPEVQQAWMTMAQKYYNATGGEKLDLGSGWRSEQTQAMLRSAGGPYPVAQGTSMHTRGMAIDLADPRQADQLEKLGLLTDFQRTVANDPIHLQFMGQSRGLAPTAGAGIFGAQGDTLSARAGAIGGGGVLGSLGGIFGGKGGRAGPGHAGKRGPSGPTTQGNPDPRHKVCPAIWQCVQSDNVF
jgi:GH24 family phage-related lysozyme (muramidase)